MDGLMMGGWMEDGWMDRRMHGWIYGQEKEYTDGFWPITITIILVIQCHLQNSPRWNPLLSFKTKQTTQNIDLLTEIYTNFKTKY